MNARRLLVVGLAMAMLAPVSIAAPGKKDKEYLEGVLFDMALAKKIKQTTVDVSTGAHTGGLSDAIESRDEYNFVVKVGRVTYTGMYTERAINKAWTYTPKAEDWPVNASVKIRIEKDERIGWDTMFMYIVRPNGKEIKTELIHVVGADGVDKCQIIKVLGMSSGTWNCASAWKK